VVLLTVINIRSNLWFLSISTNDLHNMDIAEAGSYLSQITAVFIGIITMLNAFISRHSGWQMMVEFDQIEKKVFDDIF
jgi:hypothetical protein